jgi:N utilization substance protein B
LGLRRRSRELALQFLFQNEFGLKTGGGSPFSRFAEHFNVEPEVLEYAAQLSEGISSQIADVDGVIQSNSSHWKLARMALVDLNVMRIAVFEMKYMRPGVPPTVAINEAVEVAKKYGSTDSGGFVNGILDNIAKGL